MVKAEFLFQNNVKREEDFTDLSGFRLVDRISRI